MSVIHSVCFLFCFCFQTAEWDDRKNSGGKVCVVVSEHKTATMQIAVFALTMEEAAVSKL